MSVMLAVKRVEMFRSLGMKELQDRVGVGDFKTLPGVFIYIPLFKYQ